MAGYGTETVGFAEPKLSISQSMLLGQFAEMGGSLELYGNWVPAKTLGNSDDPYTAAARVMAVAGYLENTREPLEIARQIAIDDTKQHFDKEESPGGNPWEPLSPDWLAYKQSHGYKEEILQMEGHLMDAATSQDAWIIIGETLVFDPFVLPQDDGVNYGAIQQEGRGGTLVEPGSGFESFTTGSMPARPFIGLSREAIEKISAAFAAWFEGVEQVFDAPMGINVRGSFPIIGYLPTGQPRLSTGQFGRK